MDNSGIKKLKSLSFDWNTLAPGMLSGRCCASGTCDNKPDVHNIREKPLPLISFSLDKADALKIRQKYGSLRQ